MAIKTPTELHNEIDALPINYVGGVPETEHRELLGDIVDSIGGGNQDLQSVLAINAVADLPMAISSVAGNSVSLGFNPTSGVITFRNLGGLGALDLQASSITTNRAIELPDNDGTIALLSDITGGGGASSLADVLAVGNITNGYAIQLDDNNEAYLANALGNIQVASDANNGLVLNNADGNLFFNVNDGEIYGNLTVISAPFTQINVSTNQLVSLADGIIQQGTVDAYISLDASNLTAIRVANWQDKDGTIAYLDDITSGYLPLTGTINGFPIIGNIEVNDGISIFTPNIIGLGTNNSITLTGYGVEFKADSSTESCKLEMDYGGMLLTNVNGNIVAGITGGISTQPGGRISLKAADSTNRVAIEVPSLSTNTTINILDRDGNMGVINVTDGFANDAAAATGGIPVGGLYHTSGIVKIRLT